MSGAVPPLPQYAFMGWCSAKKAQGQLLSYRRIMANNELGRKWKETVRFIFKVVSRNLLEWKIAQLLTAQAIGYSMIK
jgi:hypothetical protein